MNEIEVGQRYKDHWGKVFTTRLHGKNGYWLMEYEYGPPDTCCELYILSHCTLLSHSKLSDDNWEIFESPSDKANEILDNLIDSGMLSKASPVNPIHNPDVPDDHERLWEQTKDFIRGR